MPDRLSNSRRRSLGSAQYDGADQYRWFVGQVPPPSTRSILRCCKCLSAVPLDEFNESRRPPEWHVHAGPDTAGYKLKQLSISRPDLNMFKEHRRIPGVQSGYTRELRFGSKINPTKAHEPSISGRRSTLPQDQLNPKCLTAQSR